MPATGELFGKRAFRVLCGILAVPAFLFCFAGCYFLPREEEVLAPPVKEPEKVVYETVEAKKGTIMNEIKCTGTFVSILKEDLFYKDRGGRLKKLYVKVGDKVKKGQLLAELETEGIETDLKLQEIALEKAEIAYQKIQSQNSIDGGGKYELDLARLEVEANKIRLDSLQQELEKTKLTTPVDGDVVYVTEIAQGEYVNAYSTIVRVADPRNLQLQYSDDKVSSFSLGSEVDVKVDDTAYKGVVAATPADMPADADEKVKKSVRIKVDNLSQKVEMGDMADIRLILEKHDNVIVLPRNLVNIFKGRKFVNVLKDGVREERDVETGIQTSTDVEITKGLDEGELVITR